MKPQVKLKLNARKKYWGLVTATQEEFAKQAIHQGLGVKSVVEETKLSADTVKRFLNLARPGSKKAKPYSWLHGPYATTLFAISDSLGFEFKAQRKNGRD